MQPRRAAARRVVHQRALDPVALVHLDQVVADRRVLVLDEARREHGDRSLRPGDPDLRAALEPRREAPWRTAPPGAPRRHPVSAPITRRTTEPGFAATTAPTSDDDVASRPISSVRPSTRVVASRRTPPCPVARRIAWARTISRGKSIASSRRRRTGSRPAQLALEALVDDAVLLSRRQPAGVTVRRDARSASNSVGNTAHRSMQRRQPEQTSNTRLSSLRVSASSRNAGSTDICTAATVVRRMPAMALDGFRRTAMLERLAHETFDVLVDRRRHHRRRRGPRRRHPWPAHALVERDDFASRHLVEELQARPRRAALPAAGRGAPRLRGAARAPAAAAQRPAPRASVLPFMIPILTKDGVVSRKIARALGSAMWMYDLTGGWRIGKLHRRLKADAAFAHLPTMPRERLAVGVPVLRRHHRRRPAVPHRRPHGRRRTARSSPTAARVVGAHQGRRRAGSTGPSSTPAAATITVRARVVVNAAGVWADEVRALDEGADPDSIRPAKGVHLTVPWDKVRNDIAVVIPVPKDKRSLFVVPWGAARRRHVRAHLRRHHRHRLRRPARRPAVHRRRHRLRAAGAQRRRSPPASPPTTSPACGPGCGRSSRRRSAAGRAPPTCRAATR